MDDYSIAQQSRDCNFVCWLFSYFLRSYRRASYVAVDMDADGHIQRDVESTAAADNGHKFACSYPECSKVYSRKYRLIKHHNNGHGIENDNECSKSFKE